MPVHDYQCEVCQHTFEDLVKLEQPNPACPKCQGSTNKLLSAPANYTKEVTNRLDHFAKRYPGMERFK